MLPPEIFKYCSLISLPLFISVALLLIKKTSNFSISESTISKSVRNLDKPVHKIVFKLNFIIKAILDLGFSWYIIIKLRQPLFSSLTFFLILYVLFFGLLAFYTEENNSPIHRVLVYGLGVFWMISQTLLAFLTQNLLFIIFTNIQVLTIVLLAFGALFSKKTNVFIQIICVLIMYLWYVIYVFKFL